MDAGASGAAIRAPGAHSPVWRRRVRSLLRHAQYLDVAMLGAWVFSTVLPFSWSAPLRYMAAAYFVAGLVLFASRTTPALIRGWPTLLIPLFCVVSALWAPSASDAIRKGMLFALTSFVAVYAASRLSGRQILTIFMLVELIAAAFCYQERGIIDGAWTGVFGQKNAMAVHMFVLYVCSLAILLDKGSSKWLRLIALAAAPAGLGLILLAKSATTLIMVIGATGAILGHAFLWQPARRVRHLRAILLLVLAILGLSAALFVFGFMKLDPTDSVLGALGKDSTLTGRTYLWGIAERTMNEYPLTGVGADGFWRSEYGLANAITRYFHYEQYVKFSFHNSYLENGVAFGYPGYWATVFLAAWAIFSSALVWLRNQSTINACFLVLGVMVIVRSTTEIDLALEFSATATLLFIGAIRREKRVAGRFP